MKNALLRAWRTGDPRRFRYVKEIPEAAAGQFVRVKGIGLYRGWKYASQQYFTRTPGDLNLLTGRLADPTLKQLARYYGELVGGHGLDAGQWGAAGWATYNALTPESTTATERGR